MNAAEFFKKHTKERIVDVVVKAGTNYDNFKQIALYGGSCSGRLALSLEQNSNNEMTAYEILRQKAEEKAAA